MNDLKILVTASEAAKMLAMGQSTFWRKVAEKKLPQPVKVAGITRWRVADLHACIEIPANPTTTEAQSAHA
jgi:predicted DNA-binding transcriptional regulator AlpA